MTSPSPCAKAPPGLPASAAARSSSTARGSPSSCAQIDATGRRLWLSSTKSERTARARSAGSTWWYAATPSAARSTPSRPSSTSRVSSADRSPPCSSGLSRLIPATCGMSVFLPLSDRGSRPPTRPFWSTARRARSSSRTSPPGSASAPPCTADRLYWAMRRSLVLFTRPEDSRK